MYKLVAGNSRIVIRIIDGAEVPIDDQNEESAPVNRDYLEYRQWLEDGNQPEPADAFTAPAEPNPIEKLKEFLALNPDVAAIVTGG